MIRTETIRMRLFHVSEDPNIPAFRPRLPARQDLDPTVGLVWAIDGEHLSNFLTPRIGDHVGPAATEADRL